MELIRHREEPGRYQLSWSSTMNGVGGHVPLGTPEESAECVTEGNAQKQ